LGKLVHFENVLMVQILAKNLIFKVKNEFLYIIFTENSEDFSDKK